jgi:hypothetical protein
VHPRDRSPYPSCRSAILPTARGDISFSDNVPEPKALAPPLPIVEQHPILLKEGLDREPNSGVIGVCLKHYLSVAMA